MRYARWLRPFSDLKGDAAPVDKLIIVGQVTGSREVAELPELDAYLLTGWHIKEIQAQSTQENCRYVWLTRKDK